MLICVMGFFQPIEWVNENSSVKCSELEQEFGAVHNTVICRAGYQVKRVLHNNGAWELVYLCLWSVGQTINYACLGLDSAKSSRKGSAGFWAE